MSPWTTDNTNTNEMTSMVKEEEVPRMNTTTTPTPQRLEQALESFVEDLERLEGAVQRFEEALLEQSKKEQSKKEQSKKEQSKKEQSKKEQSKKERRNTKKALT